MNGIYQGIYDLIVRFVYGGFVGVGSWEELCSVLFSTIFSFLIVCIPFVVVGLIIKMIFDVWTNFICGGR